MHLVRTAAITVLAGLGLVASSGQASSIPTLQSKKFSIEVEGQMIWQARNDAAVPGDTGTLFSLKPLLASPLGGIRIEPTYFIGDRHQLRGVFAPLTLSGSGTFGTSVSFQGSSFAREVPIEGIYKFNSYRLTYRYVAIRDDAWSLLLGLTAKIRDAKISLTQGAVSGEKRNVGFVPLLHLAGAYRFAGGWQAELEADALAAPQGRAEDVRLGVRWAFSPTSSAALGYRVLEGGADNEEVLTFSLFHYAVGSVSFEL